MWLAVEKEHTVACRAVFRQRLGKHVPTVTDMHITIEVLLEVVFLIDLCIRL
jgi:hypothetical protein